MLLKVFRKRNKTNRQEVDEYKLIIVQQQFKIAELESHIQAYEALQQNEVLADIQALFLNQTIKGISKYGAPVKAENLSAEEWLQHAMEECADMMVYLNSLKKKTQKGDVHSC